MIASIIITNYNYSKYLDKCVNSCIDQTFDPNKYEIIFVDDNSNDDSIKRVVKYKKIFKNFVLLDNKKNIGVSASANKALKISRGKYVVRVDSDDYVDRQFLNTLVMFLSKNNNYFCVSCDYYLVDKNENKIARVSYKENPISCGIMYKKNDLLKLGGYNSKFRHREEEELRVRINKKNYKSYNIDLPLYKYLRHANNKTNSKSFKKKYKDLINKIVFKKNYKLYVKKKKKFLHQVVAIIPARLSSKRLKKKNIKKIWGKPMLYWCIKAAKKSNYIKDIFVSSESDEVLKLAKKYYVNCIKRPPELSKDNVFKIDVIRHAIKQIKKKPTLIISLQPNSPDVLSTDIDRGIEKLIMHDLNEIISTDIDGIQNAAFRIMKYQTLFQKSLSTHCGFVKTDISDIHTLKDLKKVEKYKTHEN